MSESRPLATSSEYPTGFSLSRLVPRGYSLARNDHWLAALALLFLLAIVARFLVYTDLSAHPAGRLQEWQGSDSWFYYHKARQVVEGGNTMLAGPGIMLTPELLDQASVRDWSRWLHNRMPRGAGAIYMMAASHAATGSLALYKMAALGAGGILVVLLAVAGAEIFADRRAGAIIGVIAAANQPLVLATLIPGPWIWDAFAFVALLALTLSLRRNPERMPLWLLTGLVLGVAIWLRPMFYWGAVLIPAALIAWRIRPGLRQVAACAIPFVVMMGALTARNLAAEASRYPIVGNPGWEFVRATHPLMSIQAQPPADISAMREARGRFPRVIQRSLQEPGWRAEMPSIVLLKLRMLAGARDEAWAYNADYIRRRSEILRMTTLAPDTLMAAGWGALVFLLLLRRFPRVLIAPLGVVLLHGMLFDPTGAERVLLHTLGCLLVGGAFTLAALELPARPYRSFLFLALWAASHLMLQIDDQARGSRFREADFVQAARLYRYEGKPHMMDAELDDLEALRRRERILRGYWYYRS